MGGGGPSRTSSNIQAHHDPTTMVAKVRLGYGEPSNGPPVGQMPVYRSNLYQVGQVCF